MCGLISCGAGCVKAGRCFQKFRIWSCSSPRPRTPGTIGASPKRLLPPRRQWGLVEPFGAGASHRRVSAKSPVLGGLAVRICGPLRRAVCAERFCGPLRSSGGRVLGYEKEKQNPEGNIPRGFLFFQKIPERNYSEQGLLGLFLVAQGLQAFILAAQGLQGLHGLQALPPLPIPAAWMLSAILTSSPRTPAASVQLLTP